MVPAVPTYTDYEKQFLLNALGGAALVSDSIQDLRNKYYKGMVEGSLSSGGGMAAQPIPVGKFALITRSDNSSAKLPSTQGTEYGFAAPFQAGTYDLFAIETVIAGGAGATMRIGIRNIDMATGLIGSVVGEHTFDLTGATGQKLSTGSAFVLQNKLYCVSYVRHSDTGDLCTIQKGPFSINPNVFPLQFNTGIPATGHAPFVTQLNTGIAGALPSTTVVTNVGANVDSNALPMIAVRRSA